MKNHDTQLHKSALKLRYCRCRVLLTGTPIQNDHKELHALLSIVTNGRMREYDEFKKHFAEPIKRAMSTFMT